MTITTNTDDSSDNIIVPEVNRGQCYLCQALTDFQCPKCGLFSCPHHLSSHLTKDNVCLPFIIKYKEGVGRYVVATRDIKPNEVEYSWENLTILLLTILYT